jgi:hypothetical protein
MRDLLILLNPQESVEELQFGPLPRLTGDPRNVTKLHETAFVLLMQPSSVIRGSLS